MWTNTSLCARRSTEYRMARRHGEDGITQAALSKCLPSARCRVPNASVRHLADGTAENCWSRCLVDVKIPVPRNLAD